MEEQTNKETRQDAVQSGGEGLFAKRPAETHPQEAASTGMDSLMKMARVLFMCLRIAIILVLIYLLVSGVFRVDEQNEAMLFRFGALQTRVIDAEHGESPILTSGRWYWAWPYPIDRVKELPAQKTVTVSTEKMFVPMVPPEMDTRGYLSPGGDGYLMCMNERLNVADANHHSNGIVHAVGEVNYRIVDAKKYYLSFYDDEDDKGAATLDLTGHHGEEEEMPGQPKQEDKIRGMQGIIRLLLSNAMIVEGVSWTVEELRNTTREVEGKQQTFDDCVKARLSRYFEEVDMGVEVQSVKVTINLPAAVKREFEFVFSAAEQSAAMIQQARQEADLIVKTAQNDAFRIESEAESERDRLISDAEQDSKNFLNELSILESMGDSQAYVKTVLMGKYVDTLNRINSVVDNKFVLQSTNSEPPRVRLRIPVPQPKKKPQGNAPVPAN